MNTETKSILSSKTIWGVVVAALPTIATMLGYKIADASAFTANASQIVDGLLTLGGSALAIYGRIKATASLVSKP